jgi:hypothetical protein
VILVVMSFTTNIIKKHTIIIEQNICLKAFEYNRIRF